MKAVSVIFLTKLLFISLFLINGCNVSPTKSEFNSYDIKIEKSASFGLNLTFEISDPVEYFEFKITNSYVDELRNSKWKLENDFFMDGNKVYLKSLDKFDSFTLQLYEESAKKDREYQDIIKIFLDSFLVYTPFLLANSLINSNIFIVFSDGAIKDIQNNHGYLYFGDSNLIMEGPKFNYLFDEDIPDWIRDTFLNNINNSIEWNSKALDLELGSKPLVIINYDFDSPISSYSANVSGGGVVFIQLDGDAWKEYDQLAKKVLIKLISHEVYHLWNGGIVRYSSKENMAWINEGIAEYSSFLYLMSIDDPLINKYRSEINTYVNSCKNSIASSSDWPSTLERAPYECGFLINMLIDIYQRNTPNSNLNVYSMWEYIYREAIDRGSSDFDFQDIIHYFENKPDTSHLISLISTKQNEEFWGEFEFLILKYGGKVKKITLDSMYRKTLILHLLQTNCPNTQIGFYNLETSIKLDAKECIRITQLPTIIAIEGFSIIDQVKLAYEAYKKVCDKSNIINVIGSDNQEYTLSCGDDIPYPGQIYDIDGFSDLYGRELINLF